MIGMKNAMPMRSTPLMNKVLRNTRKKSGDANSRSKNFQPAHGLPNRPPVTVNCFQASTMARHRHVPEHQEQHQRRDQQQVALLVLEQVGRPRSPTRARRAPRLRLLCLSHHGRRV